MTRIFSSLPSVGLGVIVLDSIEGIDYSAQVGGYACHDPIERGFYIPLCDSEQKDMEALMNYFTGPKWNGWCCEGIDEETALWLDSWLQKTLPDEHLVVDRQRLSESQEAWIYVIRQDANWSQYARIQNVRTFSGVLTWANSD